MFNYWYLIVHFYSHNIFVFEFLNTFEYHFCNCFIHLLWLQEKSADKNDSFDHEGRRMKMSLKTTPPNAKQKFLWQLRKQFYELVLSYGFHIYFKNSSLNLILIPIWSTYFFINGSYMYNTKNPSYNWKKQQFIRWYSKYVYMFIDKWHWHRHIQITQIENRNFVKNIFFPKIWNINRPHYSVQLLEKNDRKGIWVHPGNIYHKLNAKNLFNWKENSRSTILNIWNC